jgi:pSer/pThr/pTyr-binding forkhead associated (FHA) protein
MALRLQVTALDDPQARVFRYEFDAELAHITLGRRGGVDVLLPHPKVSLVHARIERRGQDYFIVDEGSQAGTRLNGSAVSGGERVPLRDGDRIGIGEFSLIVGLADRKGEWPAESSGSLARHMARDLLERLGPGGSQPSLTVLDGPQTGVVLTLDEVGRTFMLGRAGRGDLRLDDVDLWREHAALVRDDDGVTIRDLGAAPALAVNGERVAGARRLADGDTVTLGESTLRFSDPAEHYLEQLDDADAAELPGTDSAGLRTGKSASLPEAAERGRPEVLLAIVGGTVALLGAGALVYVFLW